MTTTLLFPQAASVTEEEVALLPSPLSKPAVAALICGGGGEHWPTAAADQPAVAAAVHSSCRSSCSNCWRSPRKSCSGSVSRPVSSSSFACLSCSCIFSLGLGDLSSHCSLASGLSACCAMKYHVEIKPTHHTVKQHSAEVYARASNLLPFYNAPLHS